jgi:hypothetical protein
VETTKPFKRMGGQKVYRADHLDPKMWAQEVIYERQVSHGSVAGTNIGGRSTMDF